MATASTIGIAQCEKQLEVQQSVELGYRDLKSEQLKVVETFVKWRDRAYIILLWLFESLCYEGLHIVFDTLLGTGGEDSSIVVVVQAPVM